ncbi:hypothetical protein NQ317_011470, partial [Molorchus minor]
MSGYKRVSFYELCRLCASSIQKEKTHIFHEEGRKIQLQNKIQVCLALTVNENDFLPKVVCSKCLRSLETCYDFRQECVRSESMLSTYFKNFRYTDDFKKSGKVYIKDVKPPPLPVQQNPEISTSSNVAALTPISGNVQIVNGNKNQSVEQNEVLSNVVVNANGEVINIAQMGDFEAILNQGIVNKKQKSHKRWRDHKIDNHSQSNNIVKVDLTNSNNVSPTYDVDQNNAKYDKLPHIKSTQKQPNKYTYPMKLEDKNQTANIGNVNVVNTNNNISPNTNLLTATNVEGSTIISINVLGQNMPELNQTGFTNVVSSGPPNVLNTPNENDDTKINGQHVKLHTGFRPYICEHCNKAFMRKEHLIRHSTLHSGQKNYQCNICEKSFSRNDNLLKHKKTHEKQSSYTCEICQKQFVMEHYYNAHKLTHGD